MQLSGSLLALALSVLLFPATARAQADNPETICTNLRSNYPTEYGNLFLSSLPEEQQLEACIDTVVIEQGQFTSEGPAGWVRVGPNDGNLANDVAFRWTAASIIYNQKRHDPPPGPRPQPEDRFIMEASNPAVAAYESQRFDWGLRECSLWHVNLLPVPTPTCAGKDFELTPERPPSPHTPPPAGHHPPASAPGVPNAPPGPPTGSQRPILAATVGHSALAYRAFTVFQRLVVNNVPAKARVKVTCTKRGCKTKTYKTAKAKRKLNLIKQFRKRKLKVGTNITITITAPNFIGKRITYTIRKRKLPSSKLVLRP